MKESFSISQRGEEGIDFVRNEGESVSVRRGKVEGRNIRVLENKTDGKNN